MLVEPLAGGRHVAVTEQRTQQEYAECLRWLVEERSPDVEDVRLLQDNLNTPGPAALYERVPPEQARAILQRLEFPDTPKHGSWLNLAAIESSIVERGCLAQPVGDRETLARRVTAVEAQRNAARCTIQWQFTSQRARPKLADLYPVKPTYLD